MPLPKLMWLRGVGAVDVEGVRVVEAARVAVGGRGEQQHLGPLGDLDPADHRGLLVIRRQEIWLES